MIREFDGVFLHNAVEDLDLGLSARVKDQAVIDRSSGAVRSTSAALDRISVPRAAYVMSVVVVAIDSSGLVARHITALDKLLDRNGALLAVHIPHHKNRNIPVFGSDDVGLRHHQTEL